MKRDDDLIRQILIELVESPEAFSEEFSFLTMTLSEQARAYHIRLLQDGGFVVVQDERNFYMDQELPSNEGRAVSRAQTIRVTSSGQDFYAAIKSDTIWARTKNAVAETGGSATLEIVKSLAMGFLKKKISQHTGVEL